MGMDLFGSNPKNITGEYFRNNVWWWRPLASYIIDKHFEIAKKMKVEPYKDENGVIHRPEEEYDPIDLWHSNSGGHLNAHWSKKLAKALREDLDSGKIDEFEADYNKWRSEQPLQECSLCNGTGIRMDKVGIENGMHDKELSAEMQVVTGRTHGTCNACAGAGKVESFASMYPFSKENVEEFTEFLDSCGGFSIY